MVSLKVYDMLGKEVETLVNKYNHAGNYSFIFNASGYASGVYYYKLDVADYSKTRKMVLIR